MQPNAAFLPLLLVLLLAFLVPPLLSRVRWLPGIVGEILAGLVIGRSGLNLVSPDVTLDFLAEVGLAFLMFLAGLEIDFSLIFPSGPGRRRVKPFLVAALSFAATVTAAGFLSLALVRRGWADDPWMLALILSTTSLGIVLPVLKERNLSGGAFGQAVLLAALLADFLTMFLITVYVALRSSGLSLDILLVGLLFVSALVAYRFGVVRVRRRRARHGLLGELAASASQTRVHAAVALLMAFIILSNFLGTEMILGAFLAGAVLSLLNRAGYEPTRHRLEGIGFGFFIPLFFITVGIRFNLPALVGNRQTLALAGIFLAAAFLIKIVPSLLFRFVVGWRETFAAGFLMSARLSLIIAAAGIGLRLGIIDDAANAAFILVAAVTSTLSPLAFNTLLPPGEKKGHRMICICGVNSMGLQVARDLRAELERVVFLESDPTETAHAREAGFEVLEGPSPAEQLRSLDRDAVRAIMVLTSDDALNLDISRQAAAIGFKRVIALVNRPAGIQEFRAAGVMPFSPTLHQTALLAVLARNPELYTLLTSPKEGPHTREIVVGNPLVAGRLIRDLGIAGDLLILSVVRNGQALVPSGNTRVEAGDMLTVLGGLAELHKLADNFE
jgi:Kef-type K+ transport system membrane component KefB/Trk K+ transport system NAD-binding subunit